MWPCQACLLSSKLVSFFNINNDPRTLPYTLIRSAPAPIPPLPHTGSKEEREHAELLMEYQNKRGGRVKLKSIVMPEMEFDHPEKVCITEKVCVVKGDIAISCCTNDAI
jgi:hypothetical protein